MSYWFGGGHPSQIVSTTILPGRETHFVRTLAAVEALFGRPLVIKNAWNCFRVAYLANALRRARFLWIRRDIADAAVSELEARYITKGASHVWTSATPANYAALMTRPPAEQVVENQYEYSRAVGDALDAHARGRFAEVWYEDFLANSADSLILAGRVLGFEPVAPLEPKLQTPAPGRELEDGDAQAVSAYVRAQHHRLASYAYATRAKTRPAWN
jgi:hypothetical protein